MTGQADTMDIFSQTYMEILDIETIPGTNDLQYYSYLKTFGNI